MSVSHLIKHALAWPGAAARITRTGRARLVVLMYHDLRPDDGYPNWMRVRVSDFARQLARLQRVGRFVTAEEAARPERLDPERLHFLATFDDGYVGNLRLALPVLERHGVPALVFVSTGPMLEQRLFWSDVVVGAVQGAGLRHLDLRGFGLGRFAFRAAGDGRWEDIERLLRALKDAGDEDAPPVADVLARLQRDHGRVLAEQFAALRPMRAEEVAELARSPLVTVGSHGHHHRLMTRLPDAELDEGLAGSRRRLEEVTGGPVRELAYPNGSCDARVAAAAAAAGYERAYLVRRGIVDEDTEPLARPRLGVDGVGPDRLLDYRLTRLLLQEGRPPRSPRTGPRPHGKVS